MNFVIVAPSFYPWPSAEGYCSTRFASALAKAGHSVHVVTFERPEEMYRRSYDRLMHPSVKITRVKYVSRRLRFPYINWRWLSVEDNDSFSIPGYIEGVKEVLSQYENPILISRTYPWAALRVAWHCRRLAARWIAHFSDPMLDGDSNTKLGRLSHWFKKIWMRRAFRDSDGVSVTCKRVIRYYREQLGPIVDKQKWILTTHIGDFKLDKKLDEKGLVGGNEVRVNSSSSSGEELGVRGKELDGRRIIFHDGDIYYGRGLQILEAVKTLNEQGVPVEFIQGRRVKNEGDRKKILETPHCFILDENATDELRARAKEAQVSFVADFNTEGLPYSPYLMSKFVYQLFADKPMVVFSKLDSEKHDYCVAYPEAGLFFADMKEPGSLEKAIKAALECDPKAIDRSRIRERFSEEHIAAEFLEQLECEDGELLKEKWMSRL